MTGREYVSGTTIQREQEVPRLHPNVIRNLAVGECCIITNGAYLELRVARLPRIPDVGMVWGKAPMSATAGATSATVADAQAEARDLVRPGPPQHVVAAAAPASDDESASDISTGVIQELADPADQPEARTDAAVSVVAEPPPARDAQATAACHT